MGADDFYPTEKGMEAFVWGCNGIRMPVAAETMAKIRKDPMIHVMMHPVIQHKITLARKAETGKRDMRELVREIATLIFYEMTRNLSLQTIMVETPLEKTEAPELSGKKPVLVKILRAGDTMVDAVLDMMMPSAKVGTIGMHRNPDDIEHPVVYFHKMPEDMPEREAFILDPMLATGWSAAEAIRLLKEYGCKKIHFACIFSVWEGIEVLRREHPDVDLYLGVVDKGLNENYYIVPGAGDMGDRLDGTK